MDALLSGFFFNEDSIGSINVGTIGWFISLTAYQIIVGHLMLKSDTNNLSTIT